MEIKTEGNTYSCITVYGYQHVITEAQDRYRVSKPTKDGKKQDILPDANYRNTGKALCGILMKGESLQSWIERHNEIVDLRKIR
jgi:hypothetical protein